MCFNSRSATQQKLKYAIQRGDQHYAEKLQQMLDDMDMLERPHWFVSGFSHPELLCFADEAPLVPQAFRWGLVPFWTKNRTDAARISKQTLNARGETMFAKPAFREAAKNKRCLIYLDAFYEHHHYKGKTYPFRIKMQDDSPMIVAGLWDEWVDRETGEILRTAAIVTTGGNATMTKIHNNPKLESGPRMPLILTKETQDDWLIACRTDSDKQQILSMLKALPDELLDYRPVGPLLGKNALGNVPEVEDEVIYEGISIGGSE